MYKRQVEQLGYLYHECERVGQDIYLFIDEYDHFINAILSDAESPVSYTHLVELPVG